MQLNISFKASFPVVASAFSRYSRNEWNSLCTTTSASAAGRFLSQRSWAQISSQNFSRTKSSSRARDTHVNKGHFSAMFKGIKASKLRYQLFRNLRNLRNLNIPQKGEKFSLFLQFRTLWNNSIFAFEAVDLS